MEKQVGLSKGENKIELTLDMGNRMQTWSEFHPTLYALNVTLATNEGKDNIITDFGMRDFATEGTQFTINGFKTFLRGKHDACVFPLTRYAPMDVKSWRKVFQTAKSYGINYYRCHSYHPPAPLLPLPTPRVSISKPSCLMGKHFTGQPSLE